MGIFSLFRHDLGGYLDGFIYLLVTKIVGIYMTKYQRGVLKHLLALTCRTRDGGKCLKCGTTEKLHTSHIYPTGKYRKMAFDLDNVKTLCSTHHLYWWHKHPIEAHEWLERTFDPNRLKRLKLRSQVTGEGSLHYKTLKVYLENELKKLDVSNSNSSRK